MSTITNAWEAFLAAIAEAQQLHASNASIATIQELLQHARELLDVIDDEIAMNGLTVHESVRIGLEHLRERLVAPRGNRLDNAALTIAATPRLG